MVTAQFIPKSLVDVFGMILLAALLIVRINLVEAFLYIKIFQTMKRLVLRQLSYIPIEKMHFRV